MEKEKDEEVHDCIDLSFMQSSDGDFDDDLGVPSSVKIIEVDGAPVAIEQTEEETQGKQLIFFTSGVYKR